MDLDQKEIYPMYDPSHVIKLLDDFPKQIKTTLTTIQKQVIPSFYLNIDKIVITGMGGSAIAGDIVADYCNAEGEIPIFVHRDYGLPNWVNSKTLVVTISHSGNTEEALDAFITGYEKKTKLFAMGTGGQLQSLAKKFRAPFVKIDYESQPRYALGHYMTALFWLMKKINVIDFSFDEIEKSILLLQNLKKKLDVGSPIRENMAKSLALDLENKIPVIIGSGNLSGVARRFKNDLNENAKTAAFFDILPEQNHNSIVGLDFPKELIGQIYYIILESKYAHPRVRLRENILINILQRKQAAHKRVLVEPSGGKFSEIAAAIMFSNYLSYYLSILYQVDPNKVDSIDLLKKKLKDNG